MAEDNIDEQTFQQDETEKQVITYIEKVLSGKDYREDMVP